MRRKGEHAIQISTHFHLTCYVKNIVSDFVLIKLCDLINGKHEKNIKQAGAELGQAQLKLGLGFTSTIDS